MGYDACIDAFAPVQKQVVENPCHDACKPEVVLAPEQQGGEDKGHPCECPYFYFGEILVDNIPQDKGTPENFFKYRDDQCSPCQSYRKKSIVVTFGQAPGVVCLLSSHGRELPVHIDPEDED